MKITKHPAERFIDWYPQHTKLYIRGESKSRDFGTTMRDYIKPLFDALVPWFDSLCLEQRKAQRAADVAALRAKADQIGHGKAIGKMYRDAADALEALPL